MKYLIILSAFFLSLPITVSATTGSGACSWHGGVNCNAGADWDGSVLCNDPGWKDSTVSYEDVCATESANEAIIFSDRLIYEHALRSANKNIEDVETKYIEILNVLFNSWNNLIRPQHEACLTVRTHNYCDVYSIKNNWIASSQQLITLNQFSQEVQVFVLQKARIGYVGNEDGIIVSDGALLNNPNFINDYNLNNDFKNRLFELSEVYGDYLRTSFVGFDPEHYKELYDQILEDIPEVTQYYIFNVATNSYDRNISFQGKIVDPDAKNLILTTTPTIQSTNVMDTGLAIKLSGKILLQVESLGEAWYINPKDGKRYYMKDGSVAYQMMRSFGLGITDSDLNKIPLSQSTNEIKNATSVCSSNPLANRMRGKFLLQVQQHGEAYYVYPNNCRMIYMKDGAAAYEIMRYLGLGITNADLGKIPSN